MRRVTPRHCVPPPLSGEALGVCSISASPERGGAVRRRRRGPAPYSRVVLCRTPPWASCPFLVSVQILKGRDAQGGVPYNGQHTSLRVWLAMSRDSGPEVGMTMLCRGDRPRSPGP